MDLCYLEESAICKAEFPFYKADELSSITTLINSEINKNVPNKIYCIENGGLDFETYIFEVQDESEDYFQKFILINVKENKIIANQEIGRSINGDAPEDSDTTDKTFVINKDLTILVFDKIYKKKNKLTIKYRMSSDGLLVIIK